MSVKDTNLDMEFDFEVGDEFDFGPIAAGPYIQKILGAGGTFEVDGSIVRITSLPPKSKVKSVPPAPVVKEAVPSPATRIAAIVEEVSNLPVVTKVAPVEKAEPAGPVEKAELAESVEKVVSVEETATKPKLVRGRPKKVTVESNEQKEEVK